MIKDIQKFKMDLTRFYEVVVPKTHLEYQKKIANKLFELILGANSGGQNHHPVDTGWARANWDIRAYATFQRPPSKSIGNYPEALKGLHTGKFQQKDVSGRIESAKPYGIIWIYNNVPYIIVLENGHSSTQAPNGMVSGALNDLQAYIAAGKFI